MPLLLSEKVRIIIEQLGDYTHQDFKGERDGKSTNTMQELYVESIYVQRRRIHDY